MYRGTQLQRLQQAPGSGAVPGVVHQLALPLLGVGKRCDGLSMLRSL